MKRNLLFLLFVFCFLLSFIAPVEAQTGFNYALPLQTSGTSVQTLGTCTDASSNVYITGFFFGTVNFNPSGTAANLTTAGSSAEIFVAKYDAKGNYQWAFHLSNSTHAEGFKITADQLGNIYLFSTVLNASGTMDMDPSTNTNNVTFNNVYANIITKYDGTKLPTDVNFFKWTMALGGGSGSTSLGCYSLITDKNNNLYVTGEFTGGTDFDPGSGTTTLSSPAGAYSMFVAKFDASKTPSTSGFFQWAKDNTFSVSSGTSYTNARCGGRNIGVDASGNVYVSGAYYAYAIPCGVTTVCDFSGGVSPSTASFSNNRLAPCISNDVQYNGFIVKYGSDGTFQWVTTMADAADGNIGGMAVDTQGDIFTTGYYGVTTDGTTNGVGNNNNTTYFDPSSTTANYLSSTGTGGMYISEYNSSGKVQWVKSLPVSSDYANQPQRLCLDEVGNIYIAGVLIGTGINFNPSGTATLSSAGSKDVFLAKYTNAGAYVSAYRWGGTGSDMLADMAVDKAGNVLTAGYFASNSTNFNPFGSTLLSYTGSSSGFLSSLGQANSDYYKWGGASSNAYTTTGNWVNAAVPGSANIAVIPTGSANNPVQVSSASALTQLVLQPTTSINLASGNIIVSDQAYNAGTISVTSGRTFQATAGINNTGTINGAGTITADILNVGTGTVSPGSATAAGLLTETGNFNNYSGNLNVKVAGSGAAGAAAGYDQLAVSGTATLAGTLNISTINSYAYSGSQTILTAGTVTGTFATVNWPTGVTNGTITYNSGSVVISVPTSTGPPTITSFSPATAAVGAIVTIIGTNFNTVPANNIVFFGGVKATVNSASATSLTVTVPRSTTYAPITVVNTTTSLMATSAKFFSQTAITAGFSSAADFVNNEIAGPYSRHANIADLDGDGLPDLISGNGIQNSNTVYRNTSTSGTVAISSAITYNTTVSDTYGIGVQDLDGDGKLDVVAAENNGSGTVLVYLNNSTSGMISLGTPIVLTAGVRPTSVTIADFDGDGKADIAIVNQGTTSANSSVELYRNTSTVGSLSFSAGITLVNGGQPFFLTAGDIDGDGKADIITSNNTTNDIYIYRNTSTSGTLSFQNGFSFAVGAAPFGVTLGDLDGDGKLDIAVCNQNDNNLSIFRNTATSGTIGSGSLAAAFTLSTVASPWGITIGDLDGDGKPEIAVNSFNSGTANITLYKNNYVSGSLSATSFSSSINLTSQTNGTKVNIVDMDGDGIPDLIGTGTGQKLDLYHNVITQQPTVQASAVTFASTTQTGTTISWTNGNGTSRVVFVKAASTGSPTVTNATTYTANTAFGSGTQISTSGWYCVYNGTGSTVSITGLIGGTAYQIAVIDYSGAAGSELYCTATGTGNPASVTTISGPSITATGTLTGFTSCVNSASLSQSFTVAGSTLGTNALTVTPPAGFELSLTSGGTYSSTAISLEATSGAVASTTVYVRLAAAGTSPVADNITISSTGATSQTVAVSGTVNAPPTITLGTIAGVITTATTFSVPHTAISGSPNQYSITTGTNALPGFTAISNAGLGVLPISVPIPASAAGSYDFNLTVTNSATGCVSAVVPFTLIVTSQKITFNALSAKAFGTADFAPGATSTLTGTPITYTSSNTNIATIVNGQIHLVSGPVPPATSITVTITASQGGGATGTATLPVDVSTVLTISKATITFAGFSKVFGAADFAPVATTTLTNTPITYSSSNTNIATVVDNYQEIHLVSGPVPPATSETVIITASVGGGSTGTATLPADVSVVMTVSKPVITFATLGTVQYSATDRNPGATSSITTVPITYNSSNTAVATIVNGLIHFVGAGTTNITASQGGGATGTATLPADVTQSLTVPAAITFSGIPAVNAATVSYAVSFSSAVTGLTTGNFLLTSTFANASVASVTGSGANYIVTVNTGGGNGSVALNLASLTGLSPRPQVTVPLTGPIYSAIPVLTIAPGALDFGISQVIGTISAAQTFTLSGLSLTANTTVSTTAPYSISKDGITYSTSISFTPTELAATPGQIISVKFSPTSLTVSSGSISCVSPGAATQMVKLTGTGFASSDATLSALTTTAGSLSPAFGTAITNYTAGVGNDISTITVSPTTNQGNATVTVNGAAVASGAISGAITLAVGPNTITIVVTAQDGVTTQTYTLTVTRAPANETITFNALPVKTYGNADFAPGATSDNSGTPITYSSDNAAVATIVNGNIHMVGQGTANITASQAADAIHNAAANVSQQLTVNKAPIIITATAKSKTYGDPDPVLAYTVTSGALVGTDAFTGSLTRNAGENVGNYAITQGTVALNTNYVLSYTGANLSITAKGLVVTANNQSRNYGTANPALTLNYSGFVNGDNVSSLTTGATATTTATVTSAPGSYVIVAAGAVALNYSFSYLPGLLTIIPLTNDNLLSLVPAVGSLSPAFSTGTLNYTMQVGEGVNDLPFTPVFEPTATATLNGTPIPNNSLSYGVPLATGSNTVYLTVTAQDGITKITYTISLYKALSPSQIVPTNILTPNGDGKNDGWIVKDIQLYPNNQVTIYDRGGRVVYTKKGYNNDWGGTVNNAPLAQGTYYYVIDLGIGSPVIKGFVTILKSK